MKKLFALTFLAATLAAGAMSVHAVVIKPRPARRAEPPVSLPSSVVRAAVFVTCRRGTASIQAFAYQGIKQFLTNDAKEAKKFLPQ